MGVEERAQTFNKARNSFEDSKVQPNAASPDVRYLDANYDAVAHFHPELLHCKRMAALLAVAEYLHKGPLPVESAFTMRKSSIPADFADTSVPVIKFHHQGGLAERERCDCLQKEVKALEQKLQEASKRVEERRQELDQAQYRLDHQHVDRYSQQSVDSYNRMVREVEAAQDRHNWAVKLHNQHVEPFKALQAAYNESAEAYNKTNFSRLVFGGVDLEVGKMGLKPIHAQEKEIMKYFRPLAEEIYEHPETAGLMQSDVSQRPTSSVVEDIKNQEEVYLNVWPVASRPKLSPVAMARQLRVVLHGLKAKPELNGCYGLLQSTEPMHGRYAIQVEKTGVPVKLRRRNFLLPSVVRLFGLSDDFLNGKCGEIIGIQDDGVDLRYRVQFPDREVAVRPRHVLLAVGSTVSVSTSDLESTSQTWEDGMEAKVTRYLPPESDPSGKEKYKERKCLVELPGGKSIKVKVGHLLA